MRRGAAKQPRMRTPLRFVLSFALSFVLRAEEGVQTAARLLPPETVMFAELHDVQRTVERLMQSSWGDLAREPEVGGFLGKLIAAAAKEAPMELRESLGQIAKTLPVSGFFAMTEMPDFQNPSAHAVPKMLLGASYRGEPQVMENLLQKLRDSVLKNASVKQAKGTIEGTEIETFADSDFSVSFAHADKQVLLATDRKLLTQALARRAGRGSRSLADTEGWQAVEKEAVTSPDATGFLSYDAFLEKLSSAAGRDAAAITAMRSLMPQFLSVSTKFDGPLMRERAYLHYRMVLPRMESKHRSLAFTGEDTFAYLESSLATMGMTVDKLIESNPLLKEAGSELEKHGLTLADISHTFGPEISFVSDWESGGLAIPTAFAAVEVRDLEKARKFIGMITEAIDPEGKLIEKEHRGAKLWSMKGPVPLVQPTVALSGTHLMFGLNPGTVTAALDHLASGKSALAESASFTGALKTVGEPNGGLGFIDSARLVERLYDRMRPFIAVAIAGNPKVSEFLDASMLPKTAALARHMPPFVAGFHAGQHGYVVESTGPVTYVAGVGGVALIAGFSIPVMTAARARAAEKAARGAEKQQ